MIIEDCHLYDEQGPRKLTFGGYLLKNLSGSVLYRLLYPLRTLNCRRDLAGSLSSTRQRNIHEIKRKQGGLLYVTSNEIRLRSRPGRCDQ